MIKSHSNQNTSDIFMSNLHKFASGKLQLDGSSRLIIVI